MRVATSRDSDLRALFIKNALVGPAEQKPDGLSGGGGAGTFAKATVF